MPALRWAVAVPCLAGCLLTGSSGAALAERRVVARVEGPGSAVTVALAGNEILYTPLSGRPSVDSVAEGRRAARIYRAPFEPLPKRFRRPSIYESTVGQNLTSLTGAQGVAAFVR